MQKDTGALGVRARKLRGGFATLAALTVVAAGAFQGVGIPQAQAAPKPINCKVPAVFVSHEAGNTALGYQVQGSSNFTEFLGGQGMEYNAIAYSKDGFIYGISLDRWLLKIGSDGIEKVVKIQNPAGGADFGFNAAFFDPSGRMWVAAGSDNGILYQVNMSTGGLTPLAGQTEKMPVVDLTYADGVAYGMAAGGRLYSVNMSSGAVSSTDVSSLGISGDAFGSAWTYGNGNLGFARNQDGRGWQIAKEGSGWRVVSSFDGPASSNNDGTYCAPDSTDLALSKKLTSSASSNADGSVSVGPSAALEWEIVAENKGGGASSGMTITDKVPSEVSKVEATMDNGKCSVKGNEISCVTTGIIDKGARRIVKVKGVGPAENGACFTNEASVLANEHDPEQANNKAASAKVCVGAVAAAVTQADKVPEKAPEIAALKPVRVAPRVLADTGN